MEPRYPIPTVGALVKGPSGRVLIVKTPKWRGLWGVPGGKIEWGEPLETALQREFREEVGLELFGIRFALLLEGVFDPQFYKPQHFLFINYYAQSRVEAITPNEEILEWAWVSPEEALGYPLNHITRTLIEGYLKEPA
ncbi:MAG: NUDIX domain-containing protein [Meiothermus sp.]|uniref:NUDIX domain-containing protein n=1 Tax=Meiothermus sp. TaxID=1955249 RepID=UPI0025D4700A|nr:NUDIX domain-containing protein [Meiothermus sp.]MCS7068662.1 NUDIX domain-containing protein [Meiothermus sp.]MCX7600759.1 NUDIX domain-containing protein [Meiothermus sp.]